MRELIVFAVTTLLLPALTIGVAALVVVVGRARRRYLGARAVPPAIEPPLGPRASPRMWRGKSVARMRYPGSSARRQRRVLQQGRLWGR